VVDQPLPGRVAIFVDGTDRAMPKLFGQTPANLVDLIPRPGLFSGEVIGILFFHPLVPTPASIATLAGPNFFRNFDPLLDFLLSLGRENVVGLHAVNVVSRVRHVIGPKH
jgi:hypothetical protein